MPKAQVPNIEATYLAWIDCREIDVESPIKTAEEAGLFLSDGAAFGQAGCVRINYGTQTHRLERALDQFITAMGGEEK